MTVAVAHIKATFNNTTVTITDTKVTGDLHDATVYYTVLGERLDSEPDFAGAAAALEKAKGVLYDLVEQLRAAAILLKPFLPRTAETIYRSFNFPQPWEEVRHEDVWVHPRQAEDLRLLAPVEDGRVKPLFPRIS